VNNVNVFPYLQLLRTNINYEGSSWGYTKYLGLSLIVISCYLMALKKGSPIKEKIPEIIVVINTLLISIISTQRTSILLLLIGLLFTLSNNRLPRIKTISLNMSLFISIFILVGFYVGKVDENTSTFNIVLLSGIESFVLYLLTPLSALAYSDIWQYPNMDGNYTLRFFFLLFDKFGIYSYEDSSLVMDFVYVPYATNVYTFLGAPVSDFGCLYFFYFMIIGIILGIVFSLPRKQVSYRVLQGFAFYPIIMSVFQDQFLTLTSTWIQILVVIFFLRILEKKAYYYIN
jgi:oligosaccharide repeat unit polymerase